MFFGWDLYDEVLAHLATEKKNNLDLLLIVYRDLSQEWIIGRPHVHAVQWSVVIDQQSTHGRRESMARQDPFPPSSKVLKVAATGCFY